MSGAHVRVDDAFETREERIRRLERDLLDASARRIHDFERRLEHEWLALRQLHEESLMTLEQRAADAGRRSSRTLAVLAGAMIALTALSAYTLARLGIELAETTARAARAERLANVLAASDVRAYPLHGQRSAAAADGQVFFSASRGVALTASRLPPTASNAAYQVWLMTSRGSISLGLVSPDGQGRVGAAFEVPSELTGSVNGFALSLEPIGGNTKPTGPIVLAS